MKIEGGATIWARQTIDSEVFYNKPDKWFKIWFYLVNKVNHKDNKRFKRGTCFMKYDWIMNATGATKNEVDHCIRWMKSATMIVTRKATRGFTVNVVEYPKFQNLQYYKSDTKSDAIGETKAKQKRNKSDTIYKNYKNLKNDKELNTIITKSSSQELQIDNIMLLYQAKFPEQRKLYGVKGVVRAREYFEGILEGECSLKDLEIAINKATKPAPWDIIKPKKPYIFHPY